MKNGGILAATMHPREGREAEQTEQTPHVREDLIIDYGRNRERLSVFACGSMLGGNTNKVSGAEWVY